MFKYLWRGAIVFLILPMLFFVYGISLAQEEVVNENGVSNVNSYELFWPLVAGKTKGDSLYSLKLFKEKLRGVFIFGDFQKVEYEVFLTTKRVVEAEKLLGSGEQGLADETLGIAFDHISKAEDDMANVDNKDKASVDEINNKLNNLETFILWLIPRNEASGSALQEILVRVQSLNQEI